MANSSSTANPSHIAVGDQSGGVHNAGASVASSGGRTIAAAHHFSIMGGQFVDVQGNYVQINNLMFTSPEAIPPLPPLRNSSTLFTGRDTHLQKLKDYFGSGNTTQKRRSFLLHGMGGIGKTQICLKFTEENLNLFSNIFWIDASSESTIELRLKQIAMANNVPPEAVSSAAFSLMWIAEKPNSLMIFDNADGGYQVVEKFLPPGNGGNILITSRNPDLIRITESSMEVVEMGEEEALSLLSKSTYLSYASGSHELQIMAKQLISMLGGIPLAIDQAGAYMMSCKCPLEDYMELYLKKQDQLMSNNFFKGASDYGSCTYGTWEISMKEIERRAAEGIGFEAVAAQSAITLYRIVAFLHHENIPEELFKAAAENYKKRDINTEQQLGLPLSVTMLNPQVMFLDSKGEWDQIQFQLGAHMLLSFSLMKKSDRMYSIHPLVNSWNRTRISEMEINAHMLMTKAILACSIELDYGVDNYKFCGLLVPHIKTIMDHHVVQLNSEIIQYDDECARFALVFHQVGNWDMEEKLRIQMMEMRKEKLGLHHLDTLVSMGNLSCTYRNKGRWDEAEELEVQVMEVSKEKFGSHHPHTLLSMANLASTYHNKGRWDEAEELEIQVMEARKEKLGSHHPHTLLSMANLASTYQDQGRWDEAEELEVQVMEASKERLGSHHPHTLNSMANLACTYQSKGRWDEAEELAVQVMEARKEKLGSHHPDTLLSMANLACTYKKKGRWDEAEELEVQVMKASKEQLGSHHPHTLLSMANLACTYWNKARWDEAEELDVQVMKKSKDMLGSHHPHTLLSMANLACTYQNQGRWDEAEELEVQVMEARKEKFGSHHPDTLLSMANLAITYWNKGRWDEAEELEVQVMEARKEKLGLHHPDT